MSKKIDAVSLHEDIYRFSVNLTEEEIGVFEGLWPIPDGVSLNNYVVFGSEKTAIIDLVCHWDGTKLEMKDDMKTASLTAEDLDYVVLNHMEPDHTGFLPDLFKLNPNLKIVTTKKAIALVKHFYHLTDDNIFIEVKSGDTLDLGGKVLHFVEVPNVHWPETMVTYESTSGILFSCDAFGSYGRIEDKIFDDQCSEKDFEFYRTEMLRYYANIVASFSVFVQRAIAKVVELNLKINMIAPSHGLIWRKNPEKVIQYYARMAGYTQGPAEKKVCVVWSSMYDNTKEVLQYIIDGIHSEGVETEVFRVPETDVGFAMSSAFESQGLVVGMPTYEYKMFPPMYYFLYILARKHIFNKDFLRFGSFGWSGGAQKELEELISDSKGNIKHNCLKEVEWQGKALPDDLKRAFSQGAALARQVKEHALSPEKVF